MSEKANKTVIGLFVLGAIGLVVAGVIMFGSGKFFSPTRTFVMYFDGSVKGLSVGSPVVFRGVRIGSVTDIRLQGDMTDMSFRVPVIAEVDMTRFQITNEPPGSFDYHKALIERGLRAQLQMQSLVTGQLLIDLDLHPDKPARIFPDTTEYPQIPTIPSTAAELARKLDELPLQQLTERVNMLVGGLEKLVNSPDMQQAPRSLNLAVTDARTLIERIDREVADLSKEARRVIHRFDSLLSFEDGPPAEVVDNLNRTLADARDSLRKFDETLDAVRNTATDERTTYQLRHTLKDLSETSRALGALVDYLGRHPETLLRGKRYLEEK